jgi:CheY-like chemotaxis protein
MQPDPDSPVTAKTARIHQILFQRYVQQFTQGDVAHQLDISPRHLRREQGLAIEALAERLRAEHSLPETVDALLLQRVPGHTAACDAEGVEQEMSWLEDSFGDQVTQVGATLHEAEKLVAGVADMHGVQLVTACAPDLPPLTVARTVLRQILLGIVTTAIHSVPGGSVSVGARAERGGVLIEVMAAANARGAWRSPERDGLEMAARLTGMFDGHLVVSKAENPFVARAHFPSAERIVALAIEDNADTLALWERYLQGTPFLLYGIRDPEQVISKAVELHPRLIILDVMMPEVDGWEVLGQLRHHPATSTIPIIVCTVLPQEELALSLGATGFMRKPVTRQSFRAALVRQIAAATPPSAPRSPA